MRIRLFVTLSLLTATSASAQEQVRLPGRGEVLNDEFTRIASVRELSDARVIVADAREKRLVIADWSNRSTRQLGRVGDGPGEYRATAVLVAVGADTTMLVDTQGRRWLRLHADTFLAPLAPETALRLLRHEPPILGVDRKGHILARRPLGGSFQRAFDSDSLLLVRARLDAEAIDTIARLRGRGSQRGSVSRSDGGRRTEYALYNPFGVEDQAFLFPDGWIAVAWLEPFRVDWIRPDGSRIRGSALERPLIASEADMRLAIANEWAWLPGPALTPSDFVAWPRTVPAFTNEALLPLPDGRLAVRRMPSALEPAPRYDVVDRSGRRSATIRLEARQRIVAFGLAGVYVVERDELDVERLIRFEIPRF